MPAPGRKRVGPEVKAARGTLQPCRDGVDTRESAASIAPIETLVPPELPLEVADVWAEYVTAAVANGARQCDADTFAEWCTMATMLRRARNATTTDGDGVVVSDPAPVPASYVAQFRMLGELLGLAGPGSRLVTRAPEAVKTNPFARNGRR